MKCWYCGEVNEPTAEECVGCGDPCWSLGLPAAGPIRYLTNTEPGVNAELTLGNPAPHVENHRWRWWVAFDWNRLHVEERWDEWVGLDEAQPWLNYRHVWKHQPWGAYDDRGRLPYSLAARIHETELEVIDESTPYDDGAVSWTLGRGAV